MMSSHCLHGAKGKAHLCQPPQEGGKLTSQRKRIGKLAQGETYQARHQKDLQCALVCGLC